MDGARPPFGAPWRARGMSAVPAPLRLLAMASRPSRLERITNLFLALLDTPRPLSLREIGVAVAGYPSEPGALRQAFERDKRTLREEGIPVAVERIDGEEQVGYRILPEQYYLPDLGLSTEEQEALAFALAAVRLEGGVGRSALAKLGPPAMPDLPPVAVLPALPALGALQQAVRTRAVVSFAYRGRRRAVEGYGLVFRRGAWYFVGRDEHAGERGELRTFRVDRLEDEPQLGDPGAYEPPPDFDAAAELRFAPWAPGPAGAGDARGVDGSGDAAEVLVDVDVREARSAIALAGDAAVVRRDPDGSVRLRFRVGDEEAFVSWVVGNGDAVELVEPTRLRSLVVERLRAAAQPQEAAGPSETP